MAELRIERKRKAPVTAKRKRALPIVVNQIYDRQTAARAAGCSAITLVRAYSSGNLQGYRIGRYVKHMGSHLLEWLESGGKTGWHKQEGGAAQ